MLLAFVVAVVRNQWYQSANINNSNKINEKLYQAVADDDAMQLRELIKKDPSLIRSEGDRLLFTACVDGRSRVVQLLLQSGVSGKKKSDDGETPLTVAVHWKHLEVVKVLLNDGGVSPNEPINPRSPFHVAAISGNLDLVRLLHQHGANINLRDSSGVTPLHYAAMNGQSLIVSYLLKNGADINAIDKVGNTALLYACMSESSERYRSVARILVTNRANTTIINKHGISAINTAAASGDKELVKILENSNYTHKKR
jgi:ankyrin repeat protein